MTVETLPPGTNLNRIVKLTCWRETIPSDSTHYLPEKLNYSQVVVEDLKIEFEIEHNLRKHPNSASVTITNLAPDTRAFLEQSPINVQIAAGYNGIARLLYSGDVRFAMTELKSPNWETLLQLGDGDCNHKFARVKRSYKSGTTLRQVVSDTVKSFGYKMPANLVNDPTLDRPLTGGTVSHGPAKDEVTRLLAPLGYTWSIQNGVFQALRQEEALSGHAWPVDEAHGMLGTPEFGSPPRSGKPPHMKVKMELYPELTAGCLIDLKSRVKSGRFRVEKVVHKGCNLDGEFVTDIEIKPIDTSAGAQTKAIGQTHTAAGAASNPVSSKFVKDFWQKQFGVKLP